MNTSAAFATQWRINGVSWAPHTTFNEYIDAMATYGTWGGEPEAWAASRLYGIRITIFERRILNVEGILTPRLNTFVYEDGMDLPHVNVIRINANHYNGIYFDQQESYARNVAATVAACVLALNHHGKQ